jgi:hypothetical protein
MGNLSWIAALALLAAPQNQSAPQNPSPAKESVTPQKRAEDRPAHESPYSAFGAPDAHRAPSGKRSGKRLHCKDGTVETAGRKAKACDGHGGVKR